MVIWTLRINFFLANVTEDMESQLSSTNDSPLHYFDVNIIISCFVQLVGFADCSNFIVSLKGTSFFQNFSLVKNFILPRNALAEPLSNLGTIIFHRVFLSAHKLLKFSNPVTHKLH